MAFPYFGYYNATKHALEASYEALWYECLDSAIQIKIIEPGFTQDTICNAWDANVWGGKAPYHQDGLSWLATSMKEGQTATPPREVAKVVVNAPVRSAKDNYAITRASTVDHCSC